MGLPHDVFGSCTQEDYLDMWIQPMLTLKGKAPLAGDLAFIIAIMVMIA